MSDFKWYTDELKDEVWAEGWDDLLAKIMENIKEIEEELDSE